MIKVKCKQRDLYCKSKIRFIKKNLTEKKTGYCIDLIVRVLYISTSVNSSRILVKLLINMFHSFLS